MERTDELLDLWPTDGTVPALRLDIDRVEPQTVLADDAVDALVATLADRTSGLGSVTADSSAQC